MEMPISDLHLLSATTESIVQQGNAGAVSNIIGIGGILATIIVGIITCVVTWKVTLRSIKQQRLSYNVKSLNILSNSVRAQQDALNELSIHFGNKRLDNPYLVLFEIENTGNEAIVNPPICIRSDNMLIPGYFQDIPPGYQSKWSMQQKSANTCNIILEHINPKQIVRVCIFVDASPEVVFECPMQNVVIQRQGDYLAPKEANVVNQFTKTQKATILLCVLLVVTFVTIDYWMELLYQLQWRNYLLAPPSGIAIFVIATLLISVLLNVFGVSKLDAYIVDKRKRKHIIACALLGCSGILLFLILKDILIVDFFLQILTAGLIVLMLSFLIHIISI